MSEPDYLAISKTQKKTYKSTILSAKQLAEMPFKVYRSLKIVSIS